jgi:hypothetical protein
VGTRGHRRARGEQHSCRRRGNMVSRGYDRHPPVQDRSRTSSDSCSATLSVVSSSLAVAPVESSRTSLFPELNVRLV